MDSTICSRCGAFPEDADHLLVGCTTAKNVWQHIWVWLKISIWAQSSTVREVLEGVQDQIRCKNWKKMVMVVTFATFWSIWRCRNEGIFNGNYIPTHKAAEMVKEETFIWMRNRYGPKVHIDFKILQEHYTDKITPPGQR
ncbi:uncharacterized protein LOC110867158 [Helianthus annuus]|uniref:uncharacterized protein LOC110867158 n=1 Tax=Helianthus annuus TaxID=4232 RepID=UPI000B8F4ACB|nr:uncharacterized protein LOC110867158 [Helianthus annuus]